MLKKITPPAPRGQKRIWPLILVMSFIGVGLGVSALAFIKPKINGNVPEFAQRKYMLVVEVSPTRAIDNAVTITASVDGAHLGPVPWLAEDINGDGKPDDWVRYVQTPNPMPFIMLSAAQLARGRIACSIYDLETGDLVPEGPGTVPYSSRPDPGAVRCYLNRPAR